LKSSLNNLNPLNMGSSTLKKPLNIYRASSAGPTTQLSPESVAKLRESSVTFSGNEVLMEEPNNQSNTIVVDQDKSFSFVKHNTSVRQSVASAANTSFSSSKHSICHKDSTPYSVH